MKTKHNDNKVLPPQSMRNLPNLPVNNYSGGKIVNMPSERVPRIDCSNCLFLSRCIIPTYHIKECFQQKGK